MPSMLSLLRRPIALVIALMPVLGSPSVTAQDKPSPPKQLIEIATREYLPPYVGQRASDGIEIDIVKAILKDTPYEAVFIQQPRVRMIAAFENKELNGILTQNVNASKVGCYTDWYISHQNVAITVKDRELQIEGLADLEGRAVLSFSGATRYLGDGFGNAIKRASRYTESGDQAKHISLLYKNRFDVIVGDSWILSLAQKRHFTKTGEYRATHKHPIMPPSLYVARFQEQAICDAFNHSLRSLRASGEYAEIWDGYTKQLVVALDSPNAEEPTQQ